MKTILSPKELAQAIGVSESSLKRWADDGRLAVGRTAGGHRRIPLPEAIRFVRESGLNLVHPEVLELPELVDARVGAEPGEDPFAASYRLLFEALRQGDEARARGVVLDLYLAGHGLAAICDGPLRDAMGRLGELWLHSASGIFVEHRATDLCIQILGLLRALAIRDASHLQHQPIALGGAPEDDPYVLPSQMAGLVLADTGYRDVNLGADTPHAALLAAIEHYQPRLVWLSCSVHPAVPSEDQLIEITRRLHAGGAKLVLGGRAMHEIPRLTRSGQFQTVGSMVELAAYARGLLASAAQHTAT